MYSGESLIVSQGRATEAQITAFFAARGKPLAEVRDGDGNPLYSPDGIYRPAPPELARSIISAAQKWPNHVVNHDLLTMQIVKESAAWQSKYARERNNPSGLGAINSDPDQAYWFDTPKDGILSTVAHLLTYAVGAGPWIEFDRRASVTPPQNWGAAPRLKDLNGKWAVPGRGYGESIAQGANELLAMKVEEMGLTESIIQRLQNRGVTVVDLRGEMKYTGGYTTMPDEAWIYTAVHHTARSKIPASLGSEKDSWLRHGIYHVDDRGWPGIAYAIGVSQSGRVFILREANLKGYHAFTANSNTFAVACDIGMDQDPSPAMLDSLHVVLRVLHDDSPEFVNMLDAPGTYAHQELGFIDSRNNGTECPGNLLAWVRDYRAGKVHDPGRERLFDTGYSLKEGFLAFYEKIESSGQAWSSIGVPLSDEIPGIWNGEHAVTIQETDVGFLQYNPVTGEVRMAKRDQSKEILKSLGFEGRSEDLIEALIKIRDIADGAIS